MSRPLPELIKSEFLKVENMWLQYFLKGPQLFVMYTMVVNCLKQCFSNFNVLMIHLGISLKCRF